MSALSYLKSKDRLARADFWGFQIGFSQDAVGGVNLQFAKETDKNIMAALDVFWSESHVQTVIHLFVFVSNEKNIRQQPQNTRFGNVPLGIAYRK